MYCLLAVLDFHLLFFSHVNLVSGVVNVLRLGVTCHFGTNFCF